MKILIASDIHGDLESAELVLNAFRKESCDKLLLLGDLLYHGPRNDLPKTYAPKAVIKLLNENKDYLMCVRGNCDTEVDQMVLEFPILADYAFIATDGLEIFATHGHAYGVKRGSFALLAKRAIEMGCDMALFGHTHEYADETLCGVRCLNPSSKGYFIITEEKIEFFEY